MKLNIYISSVLTLLLLGYFNLSPAHAEVPNVKEVNSINVYLISETGEPTITLNMTPSSPPRNIVFKYSIPRDLSNYDAWALEVNDPKRKLTYRMAFEGKAPPLLHWDGYFDEEQRIRGSQKYYFRLLLIRDEINIFTSPWSTFGVKEVEGLGAKKFEKNTVSIGVVPNGSVYAAILKTKNNRNLFFPVLYLDTKLMIEQKHIAGYRLETNSNILSNDSLTFFYSDISIFYQYRFLGRPISTPQVQYFPPYVNPDWTQKYEVKQLPKQINFTAGIRFMISTLKGINGTELDGELFGELGGFALTAHYSIPFGVLRLRADWEIGYSLFKGRFFFTHLETAATLEMFPEISVGPHLRLKYTNGKRNATSATFSNLLFLFGASCIFKI